MCLAGDLSCIDNNIVHDFLAEILEVVVALC